MKDLDLIVEKLDYIITILQMGDISQKDLDDFYLFYKYIDEHTPSDIDESELMILKQKFDLIDHLFEENKTKILRDIQSKEKEKIIISDALKSLEDFL